MNSKSTTNKTDNTPKSVVEFYKAEQCMQVLMSFVDAGVFDLKTIKAAVHLCELEEQTWKSSEKTAMSALQEKPNTLWPVSKPLMTYNNIACRDLGHRSYSAQCADKDDYALDEKSFDHVQKEDAIETALASDFSDAAADEDTQKPPTASTLKAASTAQYVLPRGEDGRIVWKDVTKAHILLSEEYAKLPSGIRKSKMKKHELVNAINKNDQELTKL